MSTDTLSAPVTNGAVDVVDPILEAAPRASKEDWLGGPGDLDEMDIEVPGLGKTVRVRALSAGMSAAVTNESMTMKGDVMRFDTHRRQVLTFVNGVIEPSMNEHEANVAAQKWGAAFTFVVTVIGELSGTSDEEIAKVRQRFRPRR